MNFPRLAVRALISDEKERILIIKRSGNQFLSWAWYLPGGKVDFGETVEQPLIKEIREETNLECTEYSFLMYQNNLPGKQSPIHFVTFYIVCKTSGTLKLNSKSDEALWVSPDVIEEYPLAFGNEEGVRRWRE